MDSISAILFNLLMLVLVLIVITYVFFQQRYKYWKKVNIYTPPTKFPYGNAKELIDGTLHIGEQFEKLYLENKTEPFFGIFLGHKPALVFTDIDLIKNILVKDFMHFTDHGLVHHEESEPLEGHLFNVNGNRWRNLRIRLLPSFTSGKMKVMFSTVVKYTMQMQDYLEPYVQAGSPVDLKELLSRFGTDIVGSCVFGIECNSISHELSKMRMMVKKSQRLNLFRAVIQNLSLAMPWLVSRLKVSMYQDEVNKYFLETAKEIIQYRKSHDLMGNDYMQTLIKLWDERNTHVESGKHVDAETEDDDTMSTGDLAAQLFVFFVDGVETSSTTASFALYELARNQDVQERLRAEIDEVIQKHNGKLSFEAFSDMKYLQQVVEETLRMYPPLPLLLRLCTKSYKIPDTNVTIEKGTNIFIPMLGIHRDPEIYPNPMQFDPERFSPENKAERHKFAHLPFGEGPRMCMGTRFGALMTRMGLVSILSKYKVTVEPKHVKPFKYLSNSFILVPIEGINLKLTKRDNALTIES